jgi:hypothetical protein
MKISHTPHGMTAAVPQVEVSRQPDFAGIRRPHGKRHAGHAVDRARVRTQFFPRAQVASFGEQPDVGVAEPRTEAVGVFDHALAERRVDLQQVMAAMGQRHVAREQAVAVDALQPGQRFAAVPRQDRDAFAAGHVHAQSIAAHVVLLMRAEAAERVGA